jgi:hypothetical protein
LADARLNINQHSGGETSLDLAAEKRDELDSLYKDPRIDPARHRKYLGLEKTKCKHLKSVKHIRDYIKYFTDNYNSIVIFEHKRYSLDSIVTDYHFTTSCAENTCYFKYHFYFPDTDLQYIYSELPNYIVELKEPRLMRKTLLAMVNVYIETRKASREDTFIGPLGKPNKLFFAQCLLGYISKREPFPADEVEYCLTQGNLGRCYAAAQHYWRTIQPQAIKNPETRPRNTFITNLFHNFLNSNPISFLFADPKNQELKKDPNSKPERSLELRNMS